MKLLCSQEQLNHMANHWPPSTLSGGLFDSSKFVSPLELISYCESTVPKEKIVQSNGREVWCYQLDEPVGFSGLVDKNEVVGLTIHSEIRNGHEVEFVYMNHLPVTHLFCLVLSNVNPNNAQVITAFPGKYAYPFPHQGLTSEEFSQAQKFWKNHLLVKKI
jgi:hypothetical protein